MKITYNRVKLLSLIANLFVVFMAQGQATIYPVPEGLQASPDYKVFVNGKEVFVYASPVPAAYCSFELHGNVQVTIKASRDIKWVDVRPYSAGVKPVFKDSTITFSLSKPLQLSVELNGTLKTPLFLFANPPEKNKPSKETPNVLFFEAGKIHYPGIIYLKSNQQVYIEGGAVVVGVIKATREKNIKVSGYGVLDGSYNNRFDDALIKEKKIENLPITGAGYYQRFLEFNDCENVQVENITLHNGTSWQIVPENCRDVHINNVKIISDQPSDDGIDIVHSKNVVVENCFIRTKDDCIAIKAYIKKGTGPRIDSVLVQAPATFKKFNTDLIQDVDSILIRDCVMWNALWGNALEIGFELNGVDVKNISFTNCDIIHVEAGAVLSIHNAGTSTVSNVLFDNIRIEDARHKLIDFAIFRSRYSEDGVEDETEMRKQYLNGAWDGVLAVPAEKKQYHAQFRGHIQDIVLNNIQITGGIFPYSILCGSDEAHAVENITISGMQVYGKRIEAIEKLRMYVEHSKKIQVR